MRISTNKSNTGIRVSTIAKVWTEQCEVWVQEEECESKRTVIFVRLNDGSGEHKTIVVSSGEE